jgi:hypothetical protein
MGSHQGAKPQAPPDPSHVPKCGCNAEVRRAVVQKPTPNKGRPYFHCALRRCGFFAWADNKPGGA